MKKLNIYAIGFIIMIILNGVLIFVTLRKPQSPPRPPSRQMNGLGEKISKQLELTPSQQKIFEELAQEHRSAMNQLDKKQKEVIKSYFSSLIEDQGDVSIMLKKIEQYESDKITLTYQHFEKLKSLCNEDQKARFGLIMKDIIGVLVGQEKNNRPPPRDF